MITVVSRHVHKAQSYEDDTTMCADTNKKLALTQKRVAEFAEKFTSGRVSFLGPEDVENDTEG